MKKAKPYLVYGRRPVQEFLRSGGDLTAIDCLWLSDSLHDKSTLQALSSLPPSLFRRTTRRELDRLYPGINHQGVLLEFKSDRSPYSVTGDWKRQIDSDPGLLLALVDLQDVQNVGSMVRSAEALGVAAIFIAGSGAKPDPVLDRISAGAVFHIPLYTVTNPDQLIRYAQRKGYWSVVAVPELPGSGGSKKEGNTADRQVRVWTTDLSLLPSSSRILLCIGGEGKGIRPLLQERADFLITIPLRGKTGSLNAAVAAGILLERLCNRPET